ncbi:hypothetical protein [Litoreibacter roseus]|uniref:Cyclic nucleotide-binding domain-containing protein n=1 Tax=Litoreibacter roseus TaxID=2601869 RepID=A0A6N6JBH6_9RHOB|nr:hypothetical protein [Litoreibacter roseus]GFE63525.1 hypothetical protein KIN_05990 [Litoreibacter roseus]
MSIKTISWPDEAQRAARALPIFAQLSEQAFDTLITASRLMTAQTGEKALDRDRPPHGFTFLLEGSWTMHRHLPGVETPVVWVDDRPGSWHGGVPAIDAIAPADVWADTPSHMMFVPASVMLPLLRTEPTVARHMLRGIHGGAELLWASTQPH